MIDKNEKFIAFSDMNKTFITETEKVNLILSYSEIESLVALLKTSERKDLPETITIKAEIQR